MQTIHLISDWHKMQNSKKLIYCERGAQPEARTRAAAQSEWPF
jgi:hypothetical protein